MTLDVIIATYGPEGIDRVSRMTLPETENVKYVVSWQNHQNVPVPENLKREDVKIHRLDGKGLSRNRNNAIENSDADIIYIADDDIILMPEALNKIMQIFEQYPDTDIATFMMKETGRKTYPGEITDLSFYLPKNYNIGACQIAFKRKYYPGIRFNTDFGINSGKFEVGEDEIFHLQFRKKGLKCRFFPEVIASHPHDATGRKKIKNPKVVEGFGALITKSYPRSFCLRVPLKAWRLYKEKRYGFWKGLLYLSTGSFKSFNIKI